MVDKMVGYGAVLIDRQTGVNYLFVPSGGISPLYNPDGSLIVTPVDADGQLIK